MLLQNKGGSGGEADAVSDELSNQDATGSGLDDAGGAEEEDEVGSGE